ncbi:MAG TPA: methyltransferase [Solirubrobacteraceae bacterium]|nr:methyltransferase [Solirubrobacteraceae bacterium]
MSVLEVDHVGTPAPTPADAAHVLGLIGGYQVSQAIYAAARLNLADLIAAGVVSSDELAERAGAVPDRVHRLLRSLAGHGLFTQTGPRSWELTPAGQTLRSDAPGSLHAMAVMWNEEHYDAFRGLLDAVRSPSPAFDQRFGTDWWTYLSTHPESSAKFNAAMGSIGRKVHAAALAAADLSGARHLVDVGGGAGALTAAFLERYPDLRATLLDRPHVIPGAEELLSETGARDRVELVAGDFFESVPAGGDVYLLSMILHDWTDEEAGRLLETIRRAIPATGRLLIIDAVLPPGDTPHFGKLLDLTMMAMLTGRERSEDEFAALLAGAGFRLVEVAQMAAPTSLIEARPR